MHENLFPFPLPSETMRLSLVAKKLNVGIQTIVEKLQEKGIQIENNPNTKLDANQLKVLSTQIRNPSAIIGTKNYLHYASINEITSIDLSDSSLIQVPEELFEYNNILSLDLSYNQITDIRFLEKLTNLQSLDLRNNRITDYSFLEKLTNLQSLDLSNNRITDILFLEKLTTLQYLFLSDNQITDIRFLEKLTNLQCLFLSDNQITDIRFLEKLTNLQILHLRNNRITDIRFLEKLTSLQVLNLISNQITFFNSKILDNNSDMEFLFLSENPIRNIPKEIFDIKSSNVLRDVKDHFESLKKKEEVFPLYEAKLLLVGRGFVGKSELAEAITNENYQFIEGRKQTEGIRISEWYPKNCTFEGNNVEFKVNLWDFGGQEIYYGTHQFFLSKNAVYLLVWDARQEEDTRTFDYWLRAIGLLSQGSPVIIVQNKADQQIKDLNREDIKKNFPFVKGFYQTSCKSPNSFDNQRLKEHIIQEMLALPHIGEPWNIHRVAVRRTLDADPRNYMRLDEYQKICIDNGLTEQESEFLSERLHNLGVILHFQDDDLKKTVILKPEWATSAFYKIIDNKKIKDENRGSFDIKDLNDVWKEAQYYSMKSELLKLMMKFELCFDYQNQQRYMVPEISSANPNFEVPDFSESENILELVYQYEFMPKSIVPRFICRNHKYIKEKMFWQSGVVLEMDNCVAVIQSSEINKKISVKISGNEANKVMYFIRKDFSMIHETVKNPKFDELIPCKSDECKTSEKSHYFKFETLISFRNEGDKEIRCEKCRKKMNINLLVEGIYFYEKSDFLHRLENKIDKGFEEIRSDIQQLNSLVTGLSETQAQQLNDLINQQLKTFKSELPQEVITEWKKATKSQTYLDNKDKLKLTLPIIPKILFYEKELSTDSFKVFSDLNNNINAIRRGEMTFSELFLKK